MALSATEKTRFLEALRGDPDFLQQVRQHVLIADLIALPEQFGNFVRLTNERFSKLEKTLAEFAELTNKRLTSLETDVGTLKTDVGTLKSDLGTLVGDNLERRARESILNIAKDELGLTRGRILLARGRDTVPQFLESINAAEEQGIITDDQVDNVLVADIIIRARRTEDKQYVHGVFEVSRTIRLSDIQRAHDRAVAVAAATQEEAVAAVIGSTIHPQQQAQADAMGVRVLVPAMLRPQQADIEEETGATAAP